jgi:hypothetical protein
VTSAAPSKSRLVERVSERLAVKHYSTKTVDAYVGWIRRFILFHGRRHPSELGSAAVETFLSHLATKQGAYGVKSPLDSGIVSPHTVAPVV